MFYFHHGQPPRQLVIGVGGAGDAMVDAILLGTIHVETEIKPVSFRNWQPSSTDGPRDVESDDDGSKVG